MSRRSFWCCAVLASSIVGCGETGASGGQGGSACDAGSIEVEQEP
jgi:hypothetical protein